MTIGGRKAPGAMAVGATVFALAACATQDPAPVYYGSARPAPAPSPAATAAQAGAEAAPAYDAAAGAPKAAPIETASLAPLDLRPESWGPSASAEARPGDDLTQGPSAAAPAPPARGIYVKVLPGETLASVAQAMETSPAALAEANGVSASAVLEPDSAVFVPGRSAHVVRPGDTLYSIARLNNLTVDQVAARNGLAPPYDLIVGARLALDGASAVPAAQTVTSTPKAGPPKVSVRTASLSEGAPQTSGFSWPVDGEIISGFGVKENGRRNDGVNIAAPKGAPVRAAADGEVLYQGAELKGYGNLVLVKHEGGWVTTYAHVDKITVRKGDKVRKGQQIATVGNSGAVEEPQLHFEIRQDLKTVDPAQVLASR